MTLTNAQPAAAGLQWIPGMRQLNSFGCSSLPKEPQPQRKQPHSVHQCRRVLLRRLGIHLVLGTGTKLATALRRPLTVFQRNSIVPARLQYFRVGTLVKQLVALKAILPRVLALVLKAILPRAPVLQQLQVSWRRLLQGTLRNRRWQRSRHSIMHSRHLC